MERQEFSALDDQSYIREGSTEDGRPGWVLFDCEGNPILVTDNRSSCFFEAANQDLKVVLLN